jgi:hypothetical protein
VRVVAAQPITPRAFVLERKKLLAVLSFILLNAGFKEETAHIFFGK